MFRKELLSNFFSTLKEPDRTYSLAKRSVERVLRASFFDFSMWPELNPELKLRSDIGTIR